MVIYSTCNLLTTMANVVTIVSEDSESSVVEIEAPKKPEPQIIDLFDDEIVINIMGEIPDSPLSPNVPWVSQYDSETGRLRKNIKKIKAKEEEEYVDDSSETIEEYEDDNNEEDTGEEDEEDEESNNEEDEEEEENNDEEDEDDEENNDEEYDEEYDEINEGGGKVIKLKNKKDIFWIISKGIKVKQTNNDNEDNEDDKGDENNDKKLKQIKNDQKSKRRKNKKDKNKNGRQGERRNDQTRRNEDRDHSQSRNDNQAQQGSSNSGPQNSHSHPHAPYPHSPFSQHFRQSPTEQQKQDDLKTHHPDHWTPEMVKFYDEDWGNEKDFEVRKLQEEMDKSPSLWEMSPKDISFWKGKDKRFSMRCFNCFGCGHESYECKEEKRIPRCHMCGLPGHIAYKCPQSICLNCGTATTGYVTKCKNCKFGLDKVCERCHLTGHIYSECTDHWRLYHSTTGTNRVRQPRKEIYKPLRQRWCCNCGRRGHLQVDCGYCVKNSDFSDTHPFVISYIKAFTHSSQDSYGYEDPSRAKRLKVSMEDNIMTNPSQKHAYHRKTSQLRNRLKALKRDLLIRGGEGNSGRRRHLGGGGGGGGGRFNQLSLL